jgi:hypothetical protein
MRHENKAILGFAWYDEAQWLLLTGVVPDRSELCETFHDWERAAIAAVRKIETQGNTVERVPVEVVALCAWCRERGLPVNGAARAEYVTSILRGKYARA